MVLAMHRWIGTFGYLWRVLGTAVCFGVAMSAGWELSWLLFGQFLELGGIVMVCMPLGAGAAVAVSVAGRKWRISTKSLIRAMVISGVAVMLGMVVVHYVPRPTTTFAFLGGRAPVFWMQASWPGYSERAYTFPGDAANVFQRARRELESVGYRVTSPRAMELRKESTSVTVGVGRVMGKHFVVDGDTLDIDHDPNWVTVDVTEPDYWIRIVAPPDRN